MTGFDPREFVVRVSSDPNDPRALITVKGTLSRAEADELRAKWIAAFRGPRAPQPMTMADEPSVN